MRLPRIEQDERRVKFLVMLSIGVTAKSLSDTFGMQYHDTSKYLMRIIKRGIKVTKIKEKTSRYITYKMTTKIEDAIKLLDIKTEPKVEKVQPYKIHANSKKYESQLMHDDKPWFIICR